MLLLDTDVMIDILRSHRPALHWLQTLGQTPIGLPGLVVMELIQGCRTRVEQQRVQSTIRPHSLFWPTPTDCSRALDDFTQYSLSHNLGMIDALIAHTVIGLGDQLATFNQKHYCVITALQLIQPYTR
jgi:predicted nucleic acid-binding protein